MAAKVEYAPEGATPEIMTDADSIQVHVQPPDNIVLIVPLPSGKSMRVTVDAKELDAALASAHEKLVEHSADADKKRLEEEAAAALAAADEMPPVPGVVIADYRAPEASSEK